MADQNYYAVVVIYNKKIEESLTCSLLRKIVGHDIQIIVVDNSTKPNENKTVCEKFGWIYLSEGKNSGLSKAYNMALDYLIGKSGCVIWFDDDSHVTQKYFDELDSILKTTDADIVAPVIMAQNGKIYSPNEARFFKNKQLKKPEGHIKMSRFNAINSCTAVRLSVYSDYRYDERLFLDQVDHNFFRDQRLLKRKFYKMNTVIHHNFSLKSKMSSMDKLKTRYRIMIPDFLIYCSQNPWTLRLGKVKVFGWGVRESVKYKDWKFLIWCMKEANKALKAQKL